MRTVLAVALVGTALAAAACSGTDEPVRDEQGQVKEQSDVSVFHLQLGDCTQNAELGEVSSVGAVPCDQPHAYEVFAVGQYQGDTYDATAIDTYAQSSCASAFEGFVGRAVADSVLEVTYLTPTVGSFDEGDRAVTCLVGTGAESTTGTMRGANR